MPVGANDFSINWYSYDETDGDFDMTKFLPKHFLAVAGLPPDWQIL
jgi:glucosylceramidase